MSDKPMELRMLFLITTPKLSEGAAEIFRQNEIPMHYRLHAQGTATGEIIDLLGLGSIDKNILVSVLPRSMTDSLFFILKKRLKLGTVNSGIAFTMPLTGTNHLMMRMLEDLNEEDKGEKKMADMKYSLVAAVFNRGYSNSVMNAAKAAGASGGTLINTRQVSTEEVSSFWGLGSGEEKEIILIVSKADQKIGIMRKITETCGMHSEAKAMVFSMPIENVMGMEDD